MSTQKATVLRLLREGGSRGVSVHTLIYEHGITRAAAIVHELSTKDGIGIENVESEPGKLARYVLTDMKAKTPPARCGCTHLQRNHVVGQGPCYGYLDEEDFFLKRPCPCEAFHAAAA